MVVGLDLSHSVHVSPAAGGTERGQYTSAASDRTSGEPRVPPDDLSLIARYGRLYCRGAHILAVAGDVETPFYLAREWRPRHDSAELQAAFQPAAKALGPGLWPADRV